jgi:hypothetical protein
MPRIIHNGQINFPADFTDSLILFTMFFFYEHMETFVRLINKYVEKEMEFERRGYSLPDRSRFFSCNTINIK